MQRWIDDPMTQWVVLHWSSICPFVFGVVVTATCRCYRRRGFVRHDPGATY